MASSSLFQRFDRLLAHRDGVVDTDGKLSQILWGWQIFCISITAIIGNGIFSDYARAAVTAGPAGLLIAIAVVGLLAIAVMDGLSEMIQLFPTVNPMVEFVDLFVDPALAKCVAVSYWFAYSSFMAIQLVSAASYWQSEMPNGWRIFFFFFCIPVGIILLNLLRVNAFAWIEASFGAIKIFLVFFISGVLIYVAGHNLTQGVTKSNPFPAISIVIQRVAFSFLGIESVATMTFEARRIVDLKVPSQIIAWITLLIYMIYAVTQNMCFDWAKNPDGIPSFLDQSPVQQESAIFLAVDKTWGSGSRLKPALKVILTFCAVSCANTTLFISSRTLFGSAKCSDHVTSILISPFARTTKKGVPKWAVILSGVFWTCWLPFVSTSGSEAAAQTIDFFGNSGSLCVLFVWGALCAAYIRYYFWFRKFRKIIPEHPILQKYNRWNKKPRPFGTMLCLLQPWLAIFGLLGSWTLVFVSPTAIWWYHDPTAASDHFAAASFFRYYLAPLLILIGWILIKIWQLNHRGGEKRRNVLFVRRKTKDTEKLLEVVENLTAWLKRTDIEMIPAPPNTTRKIQVQIQTQALPQTPLQLQVQTPVQTQATGFSTNPESPRNRTRRRSLANQSGTDHEDRDLFHDDDNSTQNSEYADTILNDDDDDDDDDRAGPTQTAAPTTTTTATTAPAGYPTSWEQQYVDARTSQLSGPNHNYSYSHSHSHSHSESPSHRSQSPEQGNRQPYWDHMHNGGRTSQRPRQTYSGSARDFIEEPEYSNLTAERRP